MVITPMIVAAQLLGSLSVASPQLSPHPTHQNDASSGNQTEQSALPPPLKPYATGRILRDRQGFKGPLLLVNSGDTSALRNFRSSMEAEHNLQGQVNTAGLGRLPVILHSQFSRRGLQRLHAHINDLRSKRAWSHDARRYFIDLRAEHVFFVELADGQMLPVSLFTPRNEFNAGKTTAAMASEYERLKADLQKHQHLIAYHRLAKTADGAAALLAEYRLPVKSIRSERELVESTGGYYHKFHVADHQAPGPATVDAFVAFYRTYIQGQKVFMSLHCQAGRGRTSTFGAMLDILANAPHVALPDILKRQHLMGGIDFDKPHTDYRHQHAVARRHFLERFYHYVAYGHFDRQTSFASWQASQPANPL